MTWRAESVRQKVVEVFEAHNPLGVEVSEGSQIIADLGIDSLSVMELIANIEDAFQDGPFKPEIPNEALREITTVGDVVKLILAKLEQHGRLSG